MNIKCK